MSLREETKKENNGRNCPASQVLSCFELNHEFRRCCVGARGGVRVPEGAQAIAHRSILVVCVCARLCKCASVQVCLRRRQKPIDNGVRIHRSDGNNR